LEKINKETAEERSEMVSSRQALHFLKIRKPRRINKNKKINKRIMPLQPSI
jgi:hypothetical protein